MRRLPSAPGRVPPWDQIRRLVRGGEASRDAPKAGTVATRAAGAIRNGRATTVGIAEASSFSGTAGAEARRVAVQVAQHSGAAAFRPLSESQQSWAARVSAARRAQRHGPTTPTTTAGKTTSTGTRRA